VDRRHLAPGLAAFLAATLVALLGLRAAAGPPERVYGASPLISTHFHHASTIEAINRMHFDVGALGNHEFDDGGDELTKLLGRVWWPPRPRSRADTTRGSPPTRR